MARPFTDNDRWLFNEGVHETLYEVLGSHADGDGTLFRVWAPNAAHVAVVGDFNGWDPGSHPMYPSESGVWETRVAGAGQGHAYKYHVTPRSGGRPLEKSDPFASHAETPPHTASKVWGTDYEWGDGAWMESRAAASSLDAPISIYEMHLGSWSRQQPMTYRDIAHGLADHLERGGFTHVELLPIMEHPYDGSWGYQTTGYFAPTSRFGTPQDFMYFVDHLHQRGFGVILDWVPSHFAVDGHGLAYFDGTHLFEHADPRQGYHPDWGSYIFNYDRNEVRSFLVSSAHSWLDRYHVDGLRVDAVASMLYLDYSRRQGEWVPNRYGGRENLGAVEFLRQLNAGLYRRYIELDPVFRSYEDNHRLLTFRGLYAFTENYVLALSHDEVVHGKRSLLDKCPGDEWQRFAALRSLFGYQWALPGKKLVFMGGEFGDPWEWNHAAELPFYLMDYPVHQGVFRWVGDLNRLYRERPELHVDDVRPQGFQWVEADDTNRSTIAFLRWANGEPVLAVINFTPVPWEAYRVGVPRAGVWRTLLCSDASEYGGSGMAPGDLQTEQPGNQGFEQSLVLTVPPLSATFLAPA